VGGARVPYEQAFVEEFKPRLANVGVIKTSGGLFNFLSAAGPGPAMVAKYGTRHGLSESGLSRAGCSGVISTPTPERSFAVQQEPLLKR